MHKLEFSSISSYLNFTNLRFFFFFWVGGSHEQITVNFFFSPSMNQQPYSRFSKYMVFISPPNPSFSPGCFPITSKLTCDLKCAALVNTGTGQYTKESIYFIYTDRSAYGSCHPYVREDTRSHVLRRLMGTIQRGKMLREIIYWLLIYPSTCMLFAVLIVLPQGKK